MSADANDWHWSLEAGGCLLRNGEPSKALAVIMDACGSHKDPLVIDIRLEDIIWNSNAASNHVPHRLFTDVSC